MIPIRDHNPSGHTPYVTYALILANIAIFVAVWDHAQSPYRLLRLYEDYALIPRFVVQGHSELGLVTSLFLHGGLAHIAGNMLFLFIFGDNIEDELGHLKFALFYLAAGVGAGLIHVASGPFSMVPTIGASGAIAGVMGAYLLLFPRARVDIFLLVRILPVPAWIMLGVWFGMQLVGGWNSAADESGVAYWAHVGGFVVGVLLILPLWIRRGGTQFWRRTHGLPPHGPAQYDLTLIPRIKRR